MGKSIRGQAKNSWQQRYRQYVTKEIKELVLSAFSLRLLEKSYDKDNYFTTIPTRFWKRLGNRITYSKLYKSSDQTGLAQQLVAKAAATEIVLDYKKQRRS